MKNSTKYILLAVVIVVLLALSVLVITNQKSQPGTPQKNAPTANTKNPQTQTPTVSAPALPPLPTDSKQAIDKETADLQKELDAVDASVADDTLSDSDLGL